MNFSFKLMFGVVCFSCMFFISSLQAQSSNIVRVLPGAEKQFQEGVAAYQMQHYRLALSKFEALAKSPILHQMMTASLLMTGKTYNRLRQYNDAIQNFDRLIQRFPISTYVDDAYYERAISYYKLGDYGVAVQNLLWIVDNSQKKPLIQKSGKLANHIMNSHLQISEMHRLLKSTKGEQSSGLLTIQLARRELMVGSSQEAVEILENFKKKYDSGTFTSQVDQLLNEARGEGIGPIRVGVLLPLTGAYAEQGLDVLRGVKFAQMQGQNHTGTPIELVVRDSRSNMVDAIKKLEELINQDNVRVIIGELQSSITAAIGALASDKNIPVIAPTATEDGVTSVGDFIFQINSTLDRKGEALAKYAIDSLGMKTFATLAPADEYGQQMTASFTATIDRLGGHIIAQSWYYGNLEDLSRQFKDIRSAAFENDTTNVAEEIRKARLQGQDLQENDIPVTSIDGFFLPAYTEDLKYLAPQCALYNIRAQLLGGEYWNDIQVLNQPQIQRYINGVIFASDYFPDEYSRNYRDFRTNFRLSMGTTPERWASFGYDAFGLLKQVIDQGAITGPEIAEKLTDISGYRGIKGDISFAEDERVNQVVNFLQFLNGRIVKLK